jgi:hypothetical protein
MWILLLANLSENWNFPTMCSKIKWWLQNHLVVGSGSQTDGNTGRPDVRTSFSISLCKEHLKDEHSYKKSWEELIAYFPWYDTGRIENYAFNNSSIVARVFVTAVTFLPSRCLATIRRFLPSRCLVTIGGYTYRHTDWREGFLAYFPYFEKIKEAYVITLLCVCLCIPLSLLGNFSLCRPYIGLLLFLYWYLFTLSPVSGDPGDCKCQ